MKCIVIYFSITGGTKQIAYAIHSGMCQTGEQCDIIRIKEVKSSDLVEYDLIGLGGPVMGLRETANLTNLIESMESLDGKHGFAFCTHGAFPADFLARTVPAMTQRGLTMIGWNNWFSAVFHPATPKPYFTDGHPDNIDLKEAEDWGKQLVGLSRKIYKGDTLLIPEFPQGKDYDALYHPLKPRQHHPNRKEIINAESVEFKVNKEKCKFPDCTFCMDNCPMDAIDFSKSPPLFNKSCIRCWQCEMTCPNCAIEIDWAPLLKAHLIKPGSGLQESLKRFEEQGRFRNLMPLEKIGWDTPFATYKKPRYKIV